MSRSCLRNRLFKRTRSGLRTYIFSASVRQHRVVVVVVARRVRGSMFINVLLIVRPNLLSIARSRRSWRDYEACFDSLGQASLSNLGLEITPCAVGVVGCSPKTFSGEPIRSETSINLAQMLNDLITKAWIRNKSQIRNIDIIHFTALFLAVTQHPLVTRGQCPQWLHRDIKFRLLISRMSASYQSLVFYPRLQQSQ